MDEANVRCVEFMSRHLVVLTCNYDSFNEDGSLLHRGTSVISGFVLNFDGFGFWVTAGHCLKNIDKNVKKRLMKIRGGGFMDYFGPAAKHRHIYPYTYTPGESLYLDERAEGLDFGVVRLDDLQYGSFIANGIVPISRANWEKQPFLEFQFYRMLGTPEERIIDPGNDDETGVFVQPTLVAVNKLDTTEVEDVPHAAWFVGQLDPAAAPLDSIVGMSGGPIYGFRRTENGQLTYHVVALQSFWRPKSRIIFGCSLPYFAEMLYERFRIALAEVAG